MVQLLIRYGTDVNEPPVPERGAIAIQAAAIGAHLQTATILQERGANLNAADAGERWSKNSSGCRGMG